MDCFRIQPDFTVSPDDEHIWGQGTVKTLCLLSRDKQCKLGKEQRLGVRDGRIALAWYGTVWCGVVWLALPSETIPSPLAPCASVRTFMRGPFVPGRQAHQ